MTPNPMELETDPRFPSGPWVGFWVQRSSMGTLRGEMELDLVFRDGRLTGLGRDRLGDFTFDGSYALGDGRCAWVKQYVGAHAVDYRGFNEGKGIWGVWELPGYGHLPGGRGGFHIWPKSMGDPTGQSLEEEADLPLAEEWTGELVGAPGR